MYDNLLNGLQRLVDRKLSEHNRNKKESSAKNKGRIRQFWINAARHERS